MEVDRNSTAAPQDLMDDLNGPNAPAMGPDGRLYFPQVFANEIWVYDLDEGRGRLAFADLSVPTAVKFDSRGRLVTSESGAGCITAIDIATGARETLAEVPKGIDNLSIGAGDRLFVSHYVDGRVAEETAGRQRVLSEPGLLGPYGLALGRDARLLAGDGLSAAAIGADGAVERLATLLVNLPGLALGASELGDDLLVLGAGGEILRYRGGRGEPDELCAGLEGPTAIYPEGPGSVLVVERLGGRLRRVHADGQTEVVVSDLQAPGAVAIGESGERYVSQGDGGAVVVIGRDGSRRPLERFDQAQGLALSGSRLLVADVGRRELVVLDMQGGRREVVVRDAPIGAPVEGVMPAAFCPVCPDGAGGFYVGCNGDGSIRRLSGR
jgi:sugar lactone lactonase YvrE